MSLVAYAASSDEDSDCETATEACTVPAEQIIENTTPIEQQQNGQKQSPTQQLKQESSKSLNLPQPRNIQNDNEIDTKISDNTPADDENFSLKLPAPKQSQTLVEEADDEFLHKKVDPSLVEKPTESLKMRKTKASTRQPVKITIPSLAELGTSDDDPVTNGKRFSVGPNLKKSCGLLSLLPPPKFNGTFSKPKVSSDPTMATTGPTATSTKTTSLIPHSVSKRQAAAALKLKQPITEKKSSLGLSYTNSDDSDADDDTGGDFFSLNTETKLPEVSVAEINAMVAKKTNRMAEFSKSLHNQQQHTAAEFNEYVQPAIAVSSSSVASTDRDEINIEALIGARAAKRSRKDDIQFIDIRQDQVASTNDEWMRNRLQSETEFQPTGRLVTAGDQPGAGTKKKHQITYLAYQAKANEAELQAMWATNRQSRRQTQSKYGF